MLEISFSTSTALIRLEKASQCFESDACLDSDVLPLKQSDTQLDAVVFRIVYSEQYVQSSISIREATS